MEKAWDIVGLNHRRLSVAAATVVVAFMLMAVATSAADPTPKDNCVITDANNRQWPCNRDIANLTTFSLHIKDRMGNRNYSMFLFCDNDIMDFYMDDGETLKLTYESVFDPVAPRPRSDDYTYHRTIPTVTCRWRYAGNYMNGVVIWDERWPEAWSCRKQGGDGPCTLLFQNREVTLISGKGGQKRRVLGDLAIKECTKNWYSFGGWLPGGLGCTYPEHAHEYVGKVVSFYEYASPW